MPRFRGDKPYHRLKIAGRLTRGRVGRYPAKHAPVGARLHLHVVALPLRHFGKPRGKAGFFHVGGVHQHRHRHAASQGIHGLIQHASGVEHGVGSERIYARCVGTEQVVAYFGEAPPLLGTQVLRATCAAAVLLGVGVQVKPAFGAPVLGVGQQGGAQVGLHGIFKFDDDAAVFGNQTPGCESQFAEVVVHHIVIVEASAQEHTVHKYFFRAGQHNDKPLPLGALEAVWPLVSLLPGDDLPVKLAPRDGGGGSKFGCWLLAIGC